MISNDCLGLIMEYLDEETRKSIRCIDKLKAIEERANCYYKMSIRSHQLEELDKKYKWIEVCNVKSLDEIKRTNKIKSQHGSICIALYFGMTN